MILEVNRKKKQLFTFDGIDVNWSQTVVTLAYLYVANETPRPINRKTIPRAKNKMPLPRANSGPTDDTLRQCGHLAKALFSVLN